MSATRTLWFEVLQKNAANPELEGLTDTDRVRLPPGETPASPYLTKALGNPEITAHNAAARTKITAKREADAAAAAAAAEAAKPMTMGGQGNEPSYEIPKGIGGGPAADPVALPDYSMKQPPAGVPAPSAAPSAPVVTTPGAGVPSQTTDPAVGTGGGMNEQGHSNVFMKFFDYIKANPQYMLPVLAMAVLGASASKKSRVGGAALGGVLGLAPAFMWAYYKDPNVKNYVANLFNKAKPAA